MKGLIKVTIAIALLVVAILFWITIFYLVSDPDFTFKDCSQFPPSWILGLILGVILNVFYFHEDCNN